MIQFYKPNPRVSGTACSFWLNKDGSVMASMIKQSSWDDKKKIGSFSKNKENPNGRVVTKLGDIEVAAIIDSIENGREWSTYHRSSKQSLQIKFGAYVRNSEQVGYSFSINKQDAEDSTNKVGFIIGFTFPEGQYLKEFLSFLLNTKFATSQSSQVDQTYEKSKFEKVQKTSVPQTSADEDDLAW